MYSKKPLYATAKTRKAAVKLKRFYTFIQYRAHFHLIVKEQVVSSVTSRLFATRRPCFLTVASIMPRVIFGRNILYKSLHFSIFPTIGQGRERLAKSTGLGWGIERFHRIFQEPPARRLCTLAYLVQNGIPHSQTVEASRYRIGAGGLAFHL